LSDGKQILNLYCFFATEDRKGVRSEQVSAAMAQFGHGVPMSLSLYTCTIWQYWLMHTMRENAPDSVKPWGIWPELSSHAFTEL
jgi:hypothetical protein